MPLINMKMLEKIKAVDPDHMVEAELCRRAFDLVANPKDWKGPIDTIVDPYIAYAPDFLAHAVYFMTATTATVKTLHDGRIHVKAAGYRMGPAGP